MVDPPQWEYIIDEEPIPPEMIEEWFDYYEAVPDWDVLHLVEGYAGKAMDIIDTAISESTPKKQP